MDEENPCFDFSSEQKTNVKSYSDEENKIRLGWKLRVGFTKNELDTRFVERAKNESHIIEILNLEHKKLEAVAA